CQKSSPGGEYDEFKEGSDLEDDGPIIGDDSLGTFVIGNKSGKNTLVQMTCCEQQCLVLLDSGAVRSVVVKRYLEQFCPKWKDYVLPVKLGNFHSSSGSLIPLGLVKVKLVVDGMAKF
ncbi:uncharacterized protein VP01_3549g1, partial [Puccinia sorghi]